MHFPGIFLGYRDENAVIPKAFSVSVWKLSAGKDINARNVSSREPQKGATVGISGCSFHRGSYTNRTLPGGFYSFTSRNCVCAT